jgi:hypothetical protein
VHGQNGSRTVRPSLRVRAREQPPERELAPVPSDAGLHGADRRRIDPASAEGDGLKPSDRPTDAEAIIVVDEHHGPLLCAGFADRATLDRVVDQYPSGQGPERRRRPSALAHGGGRCRTFPSNGGVACVGERLAPDSSRTHATGALRTVGGREGRLGLLPSRPA